MPLGPWEIAIILLILVIIFGAGRLAQVGGAMGKSVREFRSATQEAPAPAVVAAPVAVAVPQVACPTCNALNPASNKFCSVCGASIATPVVAETPALAAAPELAAQVTTHETMATGPAPHVENTCPSCATVNPPGQPFCGQCGTHLTPAAA